MNAPNRRRGETAMGAYTLVYSFNAMCLLEDETGLKTGEIIQQMQDGVGLKQLRTFIWAGLQEKHPDFSQEDAGDVIDEVGIEPAMASLQQAIEAAFSVEKKAGPKNPRKAARVGTI